MFALLVPLAVFRVTAWLAVIGASIVTILLAIFAWSTPTGRTFESYGLGSATGVWSLDWIVFWGVVIYDTLVVTGAFTISQSAGPYLRDIVGSLVCFATILVLLRFWLPAEAPGFGGKPIEPSESALAEAPLTRAGSRERVAVRAGDGGNGRRDGKGMSDEVKDVLEHRDRRPRGSRRSR